MEAIMDLPVDDELQSAPLPPTEASTSCPPPVERRYSQAIPFPSDFRDVPREAQTYSRDATSLTAAARIENVRPPSTPATDRRSSPATTPVPKPYVAAFGGHGSSKWMELADCHQEGADSGIALGGASEICD
eukprot:1319948-Amphidinium_carterae.1